MRITFAVTPGTYLECESSDLGIIEEFMDFLYLHYVDVPSKPSHVKVDLDLLDSCKRGDDV